VEVEWYAVMVGLAYVLGGGALVDGVIIGFALYGLRWVIALISPSQRVDR